MDRISVETIEVRCGDVTVRMPMSMAAAESLGQGVFVRRQLRDWYGQQAAVGTGDGHGLMLAIDADSSRYFMRIPMTGSAGEIAGNVEFLNSALRPLSREQIDEVQGGSVYPVVCDMASMIGQELAEIGQSSSVGRSQYYPEGVAAVSRAPMDGFVAALAETAPKGSSPEPRFPPIPMDSIRPIDDIVNDLAGAIRDDRICPCTTAAVAHAVSVLFSGPFPNGDLKTDHVDLLCDAFSHRLHLDGDDPEAAAGLTVIGFLRSQNSPYDGIVAREAMGINLLSVSGCKRVAAMMRFDPERNAKGMPNGAALAQSVRSHIGAALDNMVAEATPESRFLIASQAPTSGYFFSGMPNPEAPSIYVRQATKALMAFGSVPGPQNAAAIRLAEGYGSANDPSWDVTGRAPQMSDLAPMRGSRRPTQDMAGNTSPSPSP